MRLPNSGMVSSPSGTVPALMSMSSVMNFPVFEFEAILTTGTLGNPKQLPRPVVKIQTFAPPATIPVTEGGS